MKKCFILIKLLNTCYITHKGVILANELTPKKIKKNLYVHLSFKCVPNTQSKILHQSEFSTE